MTPSNYDAPGLLVSALVAAKPSGGLQIGLGYTHHIYFPMTNTNSGFGLTLDEGQAKADKWFYPSTNGTYTSSISRLGLTVAGTLQKSLLRMDSDGDGISDKIDLCRYQAEVFNGFQDADGCPDSKPDIDTDGDGVMDAADKCPAVGEDHDGFEDEDGCPDEDNDGDAIVDSDDKCPMEKEVYNNFEDEDGCPDEGGQGDPDGDGVSDADDRCPNAAEDMDGFEDEDGCPDEDNDRDAIADNADECPMEKETYNGFEDSDGCPDEAPRVYIDEGKSQIVITEKILFELNKAVIAEASFDLMNEIAKLMVDHPELTHVRVEGHTDTQGAELYNLKLSQSRAQSVVDYLVKAGANKESLDPAGFGESRPLDKGETEEAHSKNRRVEFLIIQTE